MRAWMVLGLLAPGSALASWQDDVKTAVDACAVDPAPCDLAANVVIRESRAGIWFVQDPRLTAAVLPPLLDRLARETDPMVRVALADGAAQILLDGTDVRWHAAWAELAWSDSDAAVRSVFINSLRRSPDTAALPGLRGALAHVDPATRDRAAATMGLSTHAALFVDDLLGALNEADPAVRSTIVKALGHTGDPKALPALQALAGDEAVAAVLPRALERVSPQ